MPVPAELDAARDASARLTEEWAAWEAARACEQLALQEQVKKATEVATNVDAQMQAVASERAALASGLRGELARVPTSL